MRKIPGKMREVINKDSFYKKCIHENIASNDIEIEHALSYSGRQINELFALVPVRRKYNRNPSARDKGFNQWVACWRYSLASKDYQSEIKKKYPKVNFTLKLLALEQRFDFDLEKVPELKERLFKYRLGD